MSHPDRLAATLANVAAAAAQRSGPFAPPAPGARDCRIDLKLLQHRALAAADRNAAARARLAEFAGRADLWAGTVQDGTARGFAAALEEAVALAPQAIAPRPPLDPLRSQVFTGKDLKKKKDLLVASAGARVRCTRKEGVLFVDRDAGINSPNCLRFEARADRGTLDEFAADPAERPRLFSAQFLQPQRYTQSPDFTELVLAGRLGRTPAGFACEITFTGSPTTPAVTMAVRIDNQHQDHRLRARFLGVPPALIGHACTDVREIVHSDAGGFVAFTLVRACGRLRVDDGEVAVPGAQCRGVVEHVFTLGPAG